MSKKEIVGIEEALAKAYVDYMDFASKLVRRAYHDTEFVSWVHEGIKPEPEWTQYKSEDLAHLHRLIKTADVDSAQEIVKSIGTELMSFTSFVENLLETCEHYGDVQEEAQGE